MINRTVAGRQWLFGIYFGVVRPWQCTRTSCGRATFLVSVPGIGVYFGIR